MCSSMLEKRVVKSSHDACAVINSEVASCGGEPAHGLDVESIII